MEMVKANEVREFGRRNGYIVHARGRISDALQDHYNRTFRPQGKMYVPAARKPTVDADLARQVRGLRRQAMLQIGKIDEHDLDIRALIGNVKKLESDLNFLMSEWGVW